MKKVVAFGLVLYCLIGAWGPFISLRLSSRWFFPWAFGYIVLLFIISYEAYVAPPSSSQIRQLPFRFVILGIILLNFVSQIAGGFPIGLWPVYLLFAVVIAAFSPPRQAYAMAAIILAVETANLFLSGHDVRPRLSLYAGFGLSLAAVSGAASHIMQRTHRKVTEARQDLDRLVETAADLDPLSDPGRLEALAPAHRRAAGLATVKQREIDFNGLISMIYGFVPAHTYALFLRVRDSDVFALRAIRSESSHTVLPVGTELDTGKRHLIDICAAQRQSQYLSDIASMRMPVENLGYYRPDSANPAVRSFLVIPIVQEDQSIAILAVDSLEPGAFSLETQDMLEKFAPFFLEIIEKIDLALELKMRADHFATLHAISTDLNGSLRFHEIMHAIIPLIRAVVPFDLCACLLLSERDGIRFLRIAGVHGYDSELVGQEFPLEDSPVIDQMCRQAGEPQLWERYSPDLKGKISDVFPLKEMQRPLRSLYGRVLVANGRAVGVFFIASLRPDAFTEYHRHSLIDTLMNQVSLVAYNSLLYQRIEDMARTDGLTGLLNHRTFMEKLAEKYRELERAPRPFAILLMDIDKFKGVNDKYGHPVGDLAIKAVARVLAETIRGTDFVARYGGEEFAVGMIETDRKGAEQMAERVRSIMERTVVSRVADGELRVTLSIGVAAFPEDGENRTNLVTMADEALYHAKRTGRNRVCLYRDAAANSGAAPAP